MRLIKIISLIAFFISIPFLRYSVSPDSPHVYPLPYVAMFGVLAAYSFTEAFDPAAPAGNRLRLLGLRVLFFSCIAIVFFGLYRLLVPGVSHIGI